MITTQQQPRTTMNGKPVLTVPVKTVLSMKSGFEHKLLCDGPVLSLGDACAYSCAFCYVPSVYQKLDRIREALARYNTEHGTQLKHEDVVIQRQAALEVLHDQLTHKGKAKWKDPTDRRVVYSSPADDVAANMDLVRATVEACALILEHTCWQIRLLSKSNLLPRVAAMLVDRASRHGPSKPFSVEDVQQRMIFGFSTGTFDDQVAKVFEQGTPLVSKRIEALHMLQDACFRTFAMVCPSLPLRDAAAYNDFADHAATTLRYDKCEHVWAEVINLRGESFNRTTTVLRTNGLTEQADALEWVSANPSDWERYNRATFLGHARATRAWVGKLRYLTYVDDHTRTWWQGQIAKGAVLL
jgi:DNA repair photolyase